VLPKTLGGPVIILPHVIQIASFVSWLLLMIAYFAGLHALVRWASKLPIETVWWVRWIILIVSTTLSVITLALAIWLLTIAGG
jgi:hypothetical protein